MQKLHETEKLALIQFISFVINGLKPPKPRWDSDLTRETGTVWQARLISIDQTINHHSRKAALIVFSFVQLLESN